MPRYNPKSLVAWWTAIAVALMPPICVIGLGLAQANWSLSQGGPTLPDQPLGHYPCLYVDVLIVGYSPLERAGTALFWTLFWQVFCCSLWVSAQLVRQTNLETSLKNALLTKTITFSAWNCSRAIPTGCPPTSSPLDCTNKSTCNPQASAVVRKVCAKTNGSAFTH